MRRGVNPRLTILRITSCCGGSVEMRLTRLDHLFGRERQRAGNGEQAFRRAPDGSGRSARLHAERRLGPESEVPIIVNLTPALSLVRRGCVVRKVREKNLEGEFPSPCEGEGQGEVLR